MYIYLRANIYTYICVWICMYTSIYMKSIYTDVINKRRVHRTAEHNGFLTCSFSLSVFFLWKKSLYWKGVPGAAGLWKPPLHGRGPLLEDGDWAMRRRGAGRSLVAGGPSSRRVSSQPAGMTRLVRQEADNVVRDTQRAWISTFTLNKVASIASLSKIWLGSYKKRAECCSFCTTLKQWHQENFQLSIGDASLKRSGKMCKSESITYLSLLEPAALYVSRSTAQWNGYDPELKPRGHVFINHSQPSSCIGEKGAKNSLKLDRELRRRHNDELHKQINNFLLKGWTWGSNINQVSIRMEMTSLDQLYIKGDCASIYSQYNNATRGAF